MTPTIQVGPSFKSWSLLVPLALGTVALAFSFYEVQHFATLLYGVAGVFLVGAAIVGIRIAMSRRSIRVLDDSIQVVDREGEREIPDTEILSLSLAARRNYSEGVLKSVTNTIQIWVNGRAERPIPMKHTVRSSSSDPLQAWLERITQKLYEKSRHELESGRRLRGDGWTLDKTSFELQREDASFRAQLDSLSAAEFVDDKLCLWKKGEEQPACSVHAVSRNAIVLERLLQDLIPRSEEHEPPPGSLGRVLFERSASKQMVIGLYVLAAAIMAVGVAVVLSAGERGDVANDGIIALGIGLGFGFLGFCLKRNVLRCHEYGVRRTGVFGEKKLRYADVETFATMRFVSSSMGSIAAPIST